jgi:hypothetical protein
MRVLSTSVLDIGCTSLREGGTEMEEEPAAALEWSAKYQRSVSAQGVQLNVSA